MTLNYVLAAIRHAFIGCAEREYYEAAAGIYVCCRCGKSREK